MGSNQLNRIMETVYKDIKKHLSPAVIGQFAIEHFELSEEKVKSEKMRAMFNGSYREVYSLEAGKYIKLIDKNRHEIVMSNTAMELETNSGFVNVASGNVLIGGLGLGLVVMAIQSKKEVKKILVCEKEKDIIELVQKKLPFNKKVTVLHKDIFDLTPEKGFDTIYFDIWNGICGDNYEDMKVLHRKWRRKLNEGGWMDSWRFKDCKRLKLQDNKW